MMLRFGTIALAAMALGTAATADPMLDNSYAARVHRAPPPAVGHTVYDAVVNKDGNLVHGSSGTASFAGNTGVVIVTFPVDVTSCAYVASLGRALKSGGSEERGGYVTVVRSTGFTNGVFVKTFGPRGTVRARPFHLLVAC
jgi:hypothetical protein